MTWKSFFFLTKTILFSLRICHCVEICFVHRVVCNQDWNKFKNLSQGHYWKVPADVNSLLTWDYCWLCFLLAQKFRWLYIWKGKLRNHLFKLSSLWKLCIIQYRLSFVTKLPGTMFCYKPLRYRITKIWNCCRCQMNWAEWKDFLNICLHNTK